MVNALSFLLARKTTSASLPSASSMLELADALHVQNTAASTNPTIPFTFTRASDRQRSPQSQGVSPHGRPTLDLASRNIRWEERHVGKESVSTCRSRWSP